MEKFYNEIKDSVAKIYLYDQIGSGFFSDGVAAETFARQIDEFVASGIKEIQIRIKSPGGSVFDGNAIMQSIQEVPDDVKITTHNDGLAASMGFNIWLSVPAENRFSSPNALFLIHAASTSVRGSVKDLKQAIETLEKINENLKVALKAESNLSDEAVEKLFDGDDYMYSANQMKEMGLLTNLEDKVKSPAPLMHSTKESNLEILNQLRNTEMENPSQTTEPTAHEKFIAQQNEVLKKQEEALEISNQLNLELTKQLQALSTENKALKNQAAAPTGTALPDTPASPEDTELDEFNQMIANAANYGGTISITH